MSAEIFLMTDKSKNNEFRNKYFPIAISATKTFDGPQRIRVSR